jgi:D-alanyl-D-alanine carboxypeptidase
MSKLLSALLSKRNKEEAIDRYIQSAKSLKTMTLLIESQDGKTIIEKFKGNLNKEKPFVIASVSKLYTHSIIFNLIDTHKLSYEDNLAKFFKKSDLKNLHILNGVDHTPKITVRQLLDQNTGLPDYETGKQPDSSIIFKEIMHGDKAVDFKTSIEITKSLKPKFAPGSKKRAHYANANVNLLARIAELVTEKTYEDLLSEYIIKPLRLTNTFPCKPDTKHEPIYAGNRAIIRPEYLASSIASGGIISTNSDLMTFLRAFFEGVLFSNKHISNPVFRPIQFFPLKYGSGMMKVQMSRAMSPLFPAPTLIGHSGSSGSFAFYCPDRRIYITGTINQIKARPFPLIYMYMDSLSRKSF